MRSLIISDSIIELFNNVKSTYGNNVGLNVGLTVGNIVLYKGDEHLNQSINRLLNWNTSKSLTEKS